jgi:hypothetical protein
VSVLPRSLGRRSAGRRVPRALAICFGLVASLLTACAGSRPAETVVEGEHDSSSVILRGTVALPSGAKLQDVLMVVQRASRGGEYVMPHLQDSDDGTFEVAVGLSDRWIGEELLVRLWWSPNDGSTTDHLSFPYVLESLPSMTTAVGFPDAGVLDLGVLEPTPPPHFGSVVLSTPVPLRIVVSDYEFGQWSELFDQVGVHASGFDVYSFSDRSHYWVRAETLGGMDVAAVQLPRGETVHITGPGEGNVVGRIDGALETRDPRVLAIPTIDGLRAELNDSPQRPALLASASQSWPSAPVQDGAFTIDHLLPGEYTLALITPHFDLVATRVVVVTHGTTTTCEIGPVDVR